MEFDLKAGLKNKIDKTVKVKDTAAAFNSGLVEVFATPAMIALMENTAYECVQPYLPDTHSTVGFEVNIRHLKATPVGAKVSCTAELIDVNDRKLTFAVEAFDEDGKIGTGKHIRYIINKDKFSK